MLGNNKVHAYHGPSWKKQAQFYERLSQRSQKSDSNFKEHAKSPSRIKTIVYQKFPRIKNAISVQKISLVTDGHVCSS